jgi:predicted Fe-Mo cluster-binding NifX family protein
MKILIALDNNENMDSKLSEHFGYCKYFAIHNTETKETKFVENIIDHTNEQISPVDQVLKFDINAVFTLGIGQRAIKLFNDKNITLKTGNYTKLSEVIDNVNNLKDLEESCNH